MKIYIAIAVMLLTFERSAGMLNLTTGNGDNDFPEESACDGICDCHEETGEHLYVNCTSRNLTRVPSNIPDSVVYLNLSWNNLQLVEGDFAEYESLQILVFSYNRLRVLPKDLFDGVTLLDTIEIDFNHIAQLPEEIFSNLIMLRILTLASNRIRNLPEGLFRHNTDLWSISFKSNNLETLPQNLLKTLDRLIHLDLSGNRLIRLPEFLLEHSRYARFLYFSENRLQEFPKNVFSKRLKIVELDISHNNLTLIAEDMFGKVELRDRLDLSNNFIKTIPTRLFHWKNRYHRLSHLFLNYNQLTSLQRNVFIGLYQLKSICLFGNKIASIDPLVFASDTLDTVYLFNNELVQLSYGWFTENSTTAIHVYGNKIQNVHGQFITNIRSNNTLYINCSNLIEVQRMLTKMTCVTSLFAPEIQLQPSEANKLLAKFFQKEGFTCHENAISSNISCKACPRGTYSNGANECIRCPRGGFYQDEIGKKSSSKPEAMNCKKCPKGRFVVAGGGRSQEDCVVCPDGTIEDRNAGFRACLCKDEFARRSRFGECYQCPQKGIICTGQDFQSLKPGYFWSWNFSNANLSEYSKFVLNLRTKNNSYDNRTCSYVKEIPRVHKCQRLKSCRNDLKPSIESKCATGHTGWLCNKCQKGFYTYLTRCLPCPATVTVALELILVPCLVVGFCYILRKQYETNKSRVRERKTQVSKVVSRAKVLLGFYQVVGIYLVSFHNLDWNINLLIVGKLLSFFEMNVFNTLMKSDCFHWNSKRNEKLTLPCLYCLFYPSL